MIELRTVQGDRFHSKCSTPKCEILWNPDGSPAWKVRFRIDCEVIMCGPCFDEFKKWEETHVPTGSKGMLNG